MECHISNIITNVIIDHTHNVKLCNTYIDFFSFYLRLYRICHQFI